MLRHDLQSADEKLFFFLQIFENLFLTVFWLKWEVGWFITLLLRYFQGNEEGRGFKVAKFCVTKILGV